MGNAVARQRKLENRGLETYVKFNGGYYNYRHPVMREKGIPAECFGKDKRAANDFAKEANVYFSGQRDRLASLINRNDKEHTLEYVIDRFLSEYHLICKFNTPQEELNYTEKNGKRPDNTWSYGHTNNCRTSLNKIKKAEGKRVFSTLRVPDWMGIIHDNFSGDGALKARNFCRDLYRFAIGYGLTNDLNNYPENVIVKRSEKRKRRRIEGYKEYRDRREKCPEWLQDAMDIALYTPFGRSEVVRLQRKNITKRDGKYIIQMMFRQKTGVWFEVVCPEVLEKTINRCLKRALKLGCPYLICTPQQSKGGGHKGKRWKKNHRCQVLPDYLTNKMRDIAGKQYHEIRSLSGRLLQAQGWSKERIQEYYAHGKLSTTEIYLADDKPEVKRVAPEFDKSLFIGTE